MYHVQLRQFPHNANRFNLGERELRAILYPWIAEQVVDLGERRWSALQARLTVIEGPELSVQELSMGRGWRAAERSGAEVTDRMVALARGELDVHAAGAQGARVPGDAAGAPGDPLATGVALASLLGPDAVRLLAAWRSVNDRAGGLAPSEALALAERELSGPSPSG